MKHPDTLYRPRYRTFPIYSRRERIERWFERHQWAADAIIAAIVSAAMLAVLRCLYRGMP